MQSGHVVTMPDSTTYGAVVSYICTAEGYELHGSEKVVCTENGTWSDIPKCQSKLVSFNILQKAATLGVFIQKNCENRLWLKMKGDTRYSEQGHRQNRACHQNALLSTKLMQNRLTKPVLIISCSSLSV